MSQPPYQPEDTSPGGWGPPVPPVPPVGAPAGPPPSYPPASGSEPYGGQPYGSQPYGGQQYGDQQYGNQPYGNEPYGKASNGSHAYGDQQYGDQQYGNQAYGDQQYGNQPYGGQPYGGQPYGQPGGWQEQQPYGQPGYPPYGQQPRGNGMAIAGFVLSFFIGILGLIFSIIGLRRSSEPGRGGRGLAIAGIVISALSIVFWILVGIGLANSDTNSDGTFDASSLSDSRTGADDSGADTSSAAPTTPAPAAGSDTVADACHVIIPAVTGIQSDLQNSSSLSDMLSKIGSLADTVQQQGAASGDAGFTQDTATLAAQYRALLKAAQGGGTPDFNALAKAGEQVGYDCGEAGVTD